jgi:hypothetical protein
LGVANARVQHFGALARVIVDSSDIPVVAVEPLRSEVVNLVQSAGFSIVALDITGTFAPTAQRLRSLPGRGTIKQF